MQDMSGITTEPASSPPRILVTDVSAEKSVTEQANTPNNDTKDSPKKQEDQRALGEIRAVKKANTSTEENSIESQERDETFKVRSELDDHSTSHKEENKNIFCKMCDLSFSTNAGLHRHMRAHKHTLRHDTDSEDSEGQVSNESQKQVKKRKLEYNNNDKTTNGCGGSSADDEQGPAAKRKTKTINNNFINEMQSPQNLSCPVCIEKHFDSLIALEAHMDESHSEPQAKCLLCGMNFKSQRILNFHNLMVHRPDRKSLTSKRNQSNSISGFKDCTFIDFSSEKFPQIAKEMCEKNMHKSVTEQKFRCEICTRDFPCESALNIHIKTCFPSISGERDFYSKPRRESSSAEEDARRDDFFANLNLQNKSPNYPPSVRPEPKMNTPGEYFAISKDMAVRPLIDNTKDLADIQSILSVAATGGRFDQLNHKSRDSISRASDHSTPKHNEENEEAQDGFAIEFRKMKLKGEFPCRLCSAIYPNLRALKGHNRVHLSGNGPGPYRCNMCPHSSLDKAALVRHMRTHNGDRPYECSVCNYAFTTKANCERHLRNRHSKTTREDVKRSIIYHPSEDPNNDEVNSKLNISREDVKRCSVIYTPPDADRREDRSERSTPVSHFIREPINKFNEHKIPLTLPRDLPLVIPQPRPLHPHCSLDNLRPNVPMTPEELIQARLQQGKAFGQLTQIPEFIESDGERENESDEEIDPDDEPYSNKPVNYLEVPMDLSTSEVQDDVLDLSKKKNDHNNSLESPNSDMENENFVSKSPEFNNNQSSAASVFEKTQQLILAQQQLFKGVQLQKLDPAASFYANQLSNLYRAGAAFPALGIPPGFPLHPYVLQPNLFLSPPSNPKELAEIKEKIHKDIIMGLQLSGGGLVGMDHNSIVNNMAMASERLQAFHQQAMNNIANNNESKCPTPTPVLKSEDEVKPLLQIDTESHPPTVYTNSMLSSPKINKKDTTTVTSPNSVKMVIKNGVLMPKQKQRRYRTERPFSCEHCSARFTLRSNMERHIKQQHPQHWSQRQRSNIGIPRKSPISMVPQNVTVPSLNYDNHINYMKNFNDVTNTLSDEEKDSTLPINKACSLISDQVKYAILAQQLKSQSSFPQDKTLTNSCTPQLAENEEEDEDDALVIDEEEEDTDDAKEKLSRDDNKVDGNIMAKKVAQEILVGVSTKRQNDIGKDFDWKIAGNLISRNNSIIPIPISEMEKNEDVSKTDGEKEYKQEEGDLVPVSRLLDNAVTQIPFGKYFKGDFMPNQMQSNDVVLGPHGEGSEEDEEGLVASSGSTSEGNNSGSDENRSESEATAQVPQKKKSAYSLAPNRVSCPYCHRKFPWSSSLRRHVLTHTGQKPFKCPHCPLLFTTKSNCDRHLQRKHGNHAISTQQNINPIVEISPNSIPIPGLANQGLMMRNVPERPYKCANCPSSTFSTLSNLKKHMFSKHGIIIPDSSPESPKIEDGHARPDSRNHDTHLLSDDEKSSKIAESEVKELKNCTNNFDQKSEWDNQISSKYSPSFSHDTPSNMQNTDLPFKCHLCDHSYAERQEALDHIKDLHTSEFELLMSKGALETSVGFVDELGSSTPGHRSEGGEDQGGEECGEHQRGKFPDYTNRKVVCAFCMRRFWSAEDLRRHMRTHSGERPFSCDVCRRRFTLKHSMLRHRKKHTRASTSGEEMDLSTASGDEENNSINPQNYSSSSGATASPINSSYASMPNSSTPISSKNPLLTLSGYQMAIHKNLSPDIPNNVNNNNSPPAQNYEGKMKVKNVNIEEYKRNRCSTEDNEVQDTEMESGNDLIGKLLGISDRGMINKLLTSADEAAKLLGVNK